MLMSKQGLGYMTPLELRGKQGLARLFAPFGLECTSWLCCILLALLYSFDVFSRTVAAIMFSSHLACSAFQQVPPWN